MVICKYYLSGRCQYGNNCKFDHIDPSYNRENYHYGTSSSGNHRQSLFSQSPPPLSNRRDSTNQIHADPSRFRWVSPALATKTVPASVQDQQRRSSGRSTIQDEPQKPANISRQRRSSITDEKSLLKRVQQDMEEWRESGQWPFSCYGLGCFPSLSGTGDCPSCLSFKDLSLEELRLRAYTARAEKKMADYEREVKNLKTAIGIQWENIMNLSEEEQAKMLHCLKPYMAALPDTIATKSVILADNSKPLFSFKVQPSSTENLPAPGSQVPNFSFKLSASTQPSKPQDPVSFSFKTAAGALKSSNVQEEIVPIYTDKQLLTAEELEAFEDDEFLSITVIPVRPPPKELC